MDLVLNNLQWLMCHKTKPKFFSVSLYCSEYTNTIFKGFYKKYMWLNIFFIFFYYCFLTFWIFCRFLANSCQNLSKNIPPPLPPPKPPKRPLTAFFDFLKSIRPSIIANNPGKFWLTLNTNILSNQFMLPPALTQQIVFFFFFFFFLV